MPFVKTTENNALLLLIWNYNDHADEFPILYMYLIELKI